MKTLRRFMMRIFNTISGRRADERLSEEIESHLEMQTAENIRRGLDPIEARRQALLRFGGVGKIKEESEKEQRMLRIDALWRDLKHAIRGYMKSPAFAIVAVLTLALGIGTSTTIFSVAYAVLLRPLPYSKPQQIVRIWEETPNGHRINLAQSNFEDLRSQNTTFSSMAEYEESVTSVAGGSEPIRAGIARVSKGFFGTLGITPYRGRTFAASELRPDGAPAAIVSYGYWKQYLGGSADLSKFQLELEGGVYPIIGVMPADFNFPQNVAAWIPSELDPPTPSRTAHNWRGIGRIKDGVTIARAHANLNEIAARIRHMYGREVDLNRTAVVPLANAIVGDIRSALFTVSAAVGLLLLVVCANVAGLIVARTSTRQKEFAVRASLGASRRRLLQQLIIESFVLSFSGGMLGLGLAIGGVRILPAILPADLPRQAGIGINSTVLLFALILSLLVGVSLGLFTSWRVGQNELQTTLSAGSRTYTGARASHRMRRFLLIGEIAVILIALVGAGLLGRSFMRLVSISPGFETNHLVVMQFNPPTASEGISTGESPIARQIHMLGEIATRIRRIPGAERVALSGAIPVAAGDNLADGTFLLLDGRKPPSNFAEWGQMSQNPSEIGHASYCVVGDDYFSVLGVPLIQGRLFGPDDGLNTPNVALISESLARRRWPNQDPIGRIVDFGNMDGNLKPLTIVGIVGDVRARGLDYPPSSIIYVDYRQRGMTPNSTPTVLIRTTASASTIIRPAREVLHQVAPGSPVQFSTFADDMNGWLADRRFLLLLVGLFAVSALVLAVIGVYGVVAFYVACRTQEIGVRMALGAQRSDILRSVLKEGMRTAVIGLLIGIGASLLITRFASSLLFGVSATDPMTFIGVSLLLLLAVLAASYIPARSAMRVDPMTALRYE